MSQKQQLLDMFHANGNQLTLGMMMKTNLGDEWRARMTDLRKEGYDIPAPVLDRKNPSNNLYTLIETDSMKPLSLEKQRKIKEYTEILSGYPEGHTQRPDIIAQIRKLEGK